MMSKSASYALHAALQMALAPDEPVTVATVAGRFGFPRTALAKVFQQLVRAGLAQGTRGVGGGYRLARRAADITVLDVLAVFETKPAEECCLEARMKVAPPHRAGCALRQLLDEADELLRCTYASVSLATLAKRAAGNGPRAADSSRPRVVRRPT